MLPLLFDYYEDSLEAFWAINYFINPSFRMLSVL